MCVCSEELVTHSYADNFYAKFTLTLQTTESPTPVMIGMPRLPEHFTLLEGFVVIDPQERIVHLNPIDVVESHTILLPHGSKLVNALSASAETILKCTKKKRSTRFRKSLGDTLLVDLLSAEAGNTNNNQAPSPVPPPSLPLPVELDLNSYENLQLLAAVKTFMGIVSNHIQAILNTAIQMQQQSKKASQDQRRLLIKSGSLPRGPISSRKKPTATNAVSNGNNNNTNSTTDAANINSNSEIVIDAMVDTTLPVATNINSSTDFVRPRPISTTLDANNNVNATSATANNTTSTTSALPRTPSNNPLPRVNSSVTELNLFLPTDKHPHTPVAAATINSARRDSTSNTANTATTNSTSAANSTNPAISPSPKGAVNKAKLPFRPSPKQAASKGRRQSEFGMKSPETEQTSANLSKNRNRHSLPLLKRDEEEDGPAATAHTTHGNITPQITPRGPQGPTGKVTVKARSSMLKDPTASTASTGPSAASKKLVSKTSDMSMGIAGKSKKTDKPISAKSSLHDLHAESALHTTSSNTLHTNKTTTTNTSSSLDDPFQELAILVPDTNTDSTIEPPTPPPLTHIHSMRHNSSTALVFTIDSLMSPIAYPVSHKGDNGVTSAKDAVQMSSSDTANLTGVIASATSTTSARAPAVPPLSLAGIAATNTVNTTNTIIHPHTTDTHTHVHTVSPTFDNLPSKGTDSNSEDGPRDSLNDETCSEITVTDAGGLHREEDSLNSLVGVGIRETSSNDSGDKSEGSVCSSASSLPSLKSVS